MRMKTIKRLFKTYLITFIIAFVLFTIISTVDEEINFVVMFIDVCVLIFMIAILWFTYKITMKKLNDAIVDDAYEIATQLKRHRYCNTEQLDNILKTVEEIRDQKNK